MRTIIPIILNPFTYFLNPPVCNQRPDPAGPPPYLADPDELIFNWTQSVRILKVHSEVTFLLGIWVSFYQEPKA